MNSRRARMDNKRGFLESMGFSRTALRPHGGKCLMKLRVGIPLRVFVGFAGAVLLRFLEVPEAAPDSKDDPGANPPC